MAAAAGSAVFSGALTRALDCFAPLAMTNLFNCQTARRTVDPGFRFAPSGYEHASSPPFLVRPGAAGLLLSSDPERACGTTGRRAAPAASACFWHAAPVCICTRAKPASEADFRLRSARGGFFGLLNAPRRRRYRRLRPVRANCRPDTHLDRSPVLPASVPCLPRGLTLDVKGPASWRPSHPAPRSKDGSNAPSHRSGMGEE